MTAWNGTRIRSDQDFAEESTKVAIERDSVDEGETPWALWGRDYETGLASEDVHYFATFTEAVAGIPAFLEENGFTL